MHFATENEVSQIGEVRIAAGIYGTVILALAWSRWATDCHVNITFQPFLPGLLGCSLHFLVTLHVPDLYQYDISKGDSSYAILYVPDLQYRHNILMFRTLQCMRQIYS